MNYNISFHFFAGGFFLSNSSLRLETNTDILKPDFSLIVSLILLLCSLISTSLFSFARTAACSATPRLSYSPAHKGTEKLRRLGPTRMKESVRTANRWKPRLFARAFTKASLMKYPTSLPIKDILQLLVTEIPSLSLSLSPRPESPAQIPRPLRIPKVYGKKSLEVVKKRLLLPRPPITSELQCSLCGAGYWALFAALAGPCPCPRPCLCPCAAWRTTGTRSWCAWRRDTRAAPTASPWRCRGSPRPGSTHTWGASSRSARSVVCGSSVSMLARVCTASSTMRSSTACHAPICCSTAMCYRSWLSRSP